MGEKRIAVQLVDDHAVVRGGFRCLLEACGGFRVVAESESAEQAWQDYITHKPDIVVMDISMPGMGGMEGINRILSRDRAAKILVLTMHGETLAAPVMQAGAMGYLNKRSAPRTLIQAIETIMQGKTYIGIEQNNQLMADAERRASNPFHNLSKREFEVLIAMLNEKTVPEIADTLCLSAKTVHVHKGHIMKKLGVSSMVGLTRLALAFGLEKSC